MFDVRVRVFVVRVRVFVCVCVCLCACVCVRIQCTYANGIFVVVEGLFMYRLEVIPTSGKMDPSDNF